jgi:uncharacterized protein (TIGR03435 family)
MQDLEAENKNVALSSEPAVLSARPLEEMPLKKTQTLLWFALLVVMSVWLRAQQDIAGTWQGTLSAGRELRTVVKIDKADGNELKAVLYSIDQGGASMPAGAVTFQGSTLTFTIPGLGARYEGKMSADGRTMTGTMTQGDRPLPLNLTRANAETAWAIPAPPARATPMAADASPSFEVATIKPSAPNRPGKAFNVQGRTFRTLNTTLTDMITFMYDIHSAQIVGGPAWMATDKYDLTGQPDLPGTPSLNQWKGMVRKLLADRFKLAFHKDSKELSVYALTVARTGHKLTKNDGDPNGLPALFFRGLGMLPVRNATMGEFAGTMQGAVLDRPVVDQTGLTGRFDFTLNWTPDETQFGGLGVRVPPPADNANAPPGLFTAIQEQLGLKLDAARAPVEVFVIDRAEKPSEN